MLNGKKIIALCTAMANSERNIKFIDAFNRRLAENHIQLLIYNTCTDFSMIHRQNTVNSMSLT